MINISDEKQLFLDYRFIDRADGVDLVVNPPVGDQIVLQPEKPWESYRVFFASVIDTGSGYQLFYDAMSFDDSGRARTNFCVAESDDGVNWRRPELGLFEFQGSKANNIIAPYVHGAPVYDPHGHFETPYLMIGTLSGLFDPDGLKPPENIPDPTKHVLLKDPVFGITPDTPYLFSSRDGRRWKIVTGPLCGFACDNWTNEIFYDDRVNKFVGYLRGFPGRRTVHRYETDDPCKIPWAVPRPDAKPDGYGCVYITDEIPIVMDTDDEDDWKGDVQNPVVYQYPWAQDVYLGFPGMHRGYPGVKEGPLHRFKFFNDGIDDIHLWTSRDGIRWCRPSRRPYISLGLFGDYNGGSVFSGLGIIRNKNEFWQYYTACKTTHGAVVPTDKNVACICRTRQRLDGFVSADAGHQPGQFVTPPMVFKGNTIALNINCGALGEAWVEIQDQQGTPIPGYTLADAWPVDLNHLETIVAWKGKTDVSHLQGAPIRLKFRLRLTKLHAFQFLNKP